MKKLVIISFAILFLFPKLSKAQNDAAVAVTAGLLAIGAGVAAVEQMKEQAELTATEWFLTHHPDTVSFN